MRFSVCVCESVYTCACVCSTHTCLHFSTHICANNVEMSVCFTGVCLFVSEREREQVVPPSLPLLPD